MPIRSEDCVDGSGNGTCITMPSHIWLDSVVRTAIKHGVDGEYFLKDREINRRLSLWYSCGEPVWMAAESAVQFARGQERAKREVDTLREIRGAVLVGLKGGRS